MVSLIAHGEADGRVGGAHGEVGRADGEVTKN